MKEFTIASRGSKLALWQANFVKDTLQSHGIQSVIKIIKTTGDRVQDRFLHEIGGKGLFCKELESAMLAKEADCAVHSLKDMPAKLLPQFKLPAILKRHDHRDLMILPQNSSALPKAAFDLLQGCTEVTADHLSSLPKFTIATGSLRRTNLLHAINPNINVVAIRGNVDSRIEKLNQNQDWHALILAKASIDRLGLEQLGLDPKLTIPMHAADFIPAPAQGCLAIETVADSPIASKIREIFNCETTEFCANTERHLLHLLGGDCTLPYGCHCTPKDDGWHVRAVAFQNGKRFYAEQSFELDQSFEYIAGELFEALRSSGYQLKDQ